MISWSRACEPGRRCPVDCRGGCRPASRSACRPHAGAQAPSAHCPLRAAAGRVPNQRCDRRSAARSRIICSRRQSERTLFAVLVASVAAWSCPSPKAWPRISSPRRIQLTSSRLPPGLFRAGGRARACRFPEVEGMAAASSSMIENSARYSAGPSRGTPGPVDLHGERRDVLVPRPSRAWRCRPACWRRSGRDRRSRRCCSSRNAAARGRDCRRTCGSCPCRSSRRRGRDGVVIRLARRLQGKVRPSAQPRRAWCRRSRRWRGRGLPGFLG